MRTTYNSEANKDFLFHGCTTTLSNKEIQNFKNKCQQHSHNISYNPYAEIHRSSLKIIQNYYIRKGSGSHRETFLLAFFCACADEHNTCAVAVNGICMGKSCALVSGRFLLTKFCSRMLAGMDVEPSGKGLGLHCDTLSSRYKPHSRQ